LPVSERRDNADTIEWLVQFYATRSIERGAKDMPSILRAESCGTILFEDCPSGSATLRFTFCYDSLDK